MVAASDIAVNINIFLEHSENTKKPDGIVGN
jgi:hypothetical protein